MSICKQFVSRGLKRVSKVNFTANRVQGHSCPDGKAQAFLWDTEVMGLGLRASPGGKLAYVFQSRYQDKTLRMTIGGPAHWSIPEARAKTREYQRHIDEGRDPRQVKSDLEEADKSRREAKRRKGTSIGDLWSQYLQERKPHWSESNYFAHVKAAQRGGAQYRRIRKEKETKPGPLSEFMDLSITELTPQVIEEWAKKEAKNRSSYLRLSLRLLRAFLNWAADSRVMGEIVDKDAASGRRIREIAGKPKVRKDYVQREQLPSWFAQVQALENQVISAYLQCLLLTGARREELLQLRWRDVNFRWQGMQIRDKVEGDREIPLTPYVARMIKGLPRCNRWVFSSPTSASGRLIDPSDAHRRACRAAGVKVSLHGLRRSFRSLSEWQELPVGVVAQIMGHKPSATAEKHYTVRPLDLLRIHHEKLECWVLEQAGVTYECAGNTEVFSVVSGGRRG